MDSLNLQTAAPRSAASDAAAIASFVPQSSTWVKLRDLPSPYSFDEAWLLCEANDGHWVAWIPNYGERLLAPGEFYALS
jgi:hypothetical protein